MVIDRTVIVRPGRPSSSKVSEYVGYATRLKAEKMHFVAENHDLRTQTLTLQDKNRSLRTQNLTLRDENRSLRTQKLTLQDENSSLKRKLDDLEPEEPITELEGDLFEMAPKGSVLIHATNCVGKWGAGIALEFKRRFPTAFEQYKFVCTNTKKDILVGSALLLHPAPLTTPRSALNKEERDYWIACLFTSKGYAQKKGSVDDILWNTETAMKDLLVKLSVERMAGWDLGELWACSINSGNFGVPWYRTKEVLQEVIVEKNRLMDEYQTLTVAMPPAKRINHGKGRKQSGTSTGSESDSG